MTSLPVHLTPEFDAAVRSVLEDTSWAAGLTVAVTDRDGMLAQASYGMADLAARKPVENGALFEIGSISKGFTAALLLQARDRGLLDLDDPVTRHLPWFDVRSTFGPITIRHLLTHTAGIVSGAEYTGDATFEVWALRETEATTPPGSWFYYSNTGYKALGLVIEAVYGRPYDQVLRDQLLSPLGMGDSDAAITHDTRRRMAVGYAPIYDDRPPQRTDELVPATWVETTTADGSIASNSADMTAWMRLILGNGRAADGTPILQPGSLREMLTGAIDTEYGSYWYGLGMDAWNRDDRYYVGHTGGMPGYNSAIVCDPDRGLAAVVLANGSGPWSDVAHYAIAWVAAERAGSPAPSLELTPAMVEEPPTSPSPIDEPPAEWAAIVGHYRGYNPWLPNIRVQCSAGRLWAWQGDFTSDLGDPLTALPDGSFRVGDDDRSPERLHFDVVLNGKATRAVLSGYAMYRTFTP